LILHFALQDNVEYTIGFQFFIMCVCFMHAFLGAGVVLKKRWAFLCFKYYLYMLFLVIPIGTYVAVITLRYMKKHNFHMLFNQ
jgi:hypothetical protein